MSIETAEGFVETEGVRLAYRVDGADGAPWLVLSNSIGTNRHMWDAQLPRLAMHFQVVRYDTRGHGSSDAPPGPYTLERLGLDLVAVLDALGIAQAYVCGLSLGGLTAQWLAIHRPERVERLVLANTAARIGTEATWNERIVAVRAGGLAAIQDGVVQRLLSETFRRDHPTETEMVTRMVGAMNAEGYIGACAAVRDADLRGSVACIRAPTLIIGGELDVATPPADAYELHRAITNSKLVMLAGAAHLSNIERTDEFARAVLAFLR